MMTVGDLKAVGQEQISSTTSDLDIELILSFVTGMSKEQLFLDKKLLLDRPKIDLILTLFERVSAGEPMAYILKNKEFFGYDFYVDERVLIPRPETEFLVEKALRFMDELVGELSILDVGTGSGNIGISIAKSADRERIKKITMIDIDSGAIEVARINAERHSIKDLVEIYKGDLLEDFDEGNYQIIIANLPYIGTKKHQFVSPNVACFEPHIALFGGRDGLILYKKLFQQLIARRLKFKFLLGEIGFSQAADLSLILDSFFPGNWEILRDLAGLDRYFIVKK